MKTILITILLLLLVSCGKGPSPSAPELEKCIAGSEPACTQLPDNNEVEEEEEPIPVVEEPVVQPVVQIPWTPSLSGRGDTGYSDMLYINKFSLFLYNFDNTNVINERLEVVFKSSNIRNVPNVGKRYAKAYFKDGYHVRIEAIDADTHEVKTTYNYEWTLHTNWNLTINNNYLGTQLKTENQALFGASRWDHNIQVKDYEHCEYFLWTSSCWWVYKEEGVYAKYYYE